MRGNDCGLCCSAVTGLTGDTVGETNLVRDGGAGCVGLDEGNQDATRVDEVAWLIEGHTPGEPCPLVSGWMPHLPPVPRAIGKGAAIPERRVGVQGYSGRNVSSFADSGSRLTYGR